MIRVIFFLSATLVMMVSFQNCAKPNSKLVSGMTTEISKFDKTNIECNRVFIGPDINFDKSPEVLCENFIDQQTVRYVLVDNYEDTVIANLFVDDSFATERCNYFFTSAKTETGFYSFCMNTPEDQSIRMQHVQDQTLPAANYDFDLVDSQEEFEKVNWSDSSGHFDKTQIQALTVKQK